jgi:ribosomal protein L37AE/L43A
MKPGGTQGSAGGKLTRCPSCGFDLSGRSIDELSACPKCGKDLKGAMV